MGSKLYVGGLPYSATEQQLSDLFGAHGTVASARIIADKFTGQSRGFGFVEMSSDSEAKAAITALNGSDMGGRTLTVNEAKPMEQRSGGGGGGFGGGGGRGAAAESAIAGKRLTLIEQAKGCHESMAPFFCLFFADTSAEESSIEPLVNSLAAEPITSTSPLFEISRWH